MLAASPATRKLTIAPRQALGNLRQSAKSSATPGRLLVQRRNFPGHRSPLSCRASNPALSDLQVFGTSSGRSAFELTSNGAARAVKASAGAAAGPMASTIEDAPTDVVTPKPVEHLVFFKVKPEKEEESKAMVEALSGLASLPGVLHLYAGARVPKEVQEGDVGGDWTHALYGRYENKEALEKYSASPEHVKVVSEKVKPIAEEVMALDWEVEDSQGSATPGLKLLRAYMLELTDEDASAILGGNLEATKRLESSLSGSITWVSVGKNFAPARAKGHTYGLLVAFSEEDGLKKFESSVEQTLLISAGLLKSAKKYASIDFLPQAKL